MIPRNVYCFRCDFCDSVLNDNASIDRRGISNKAWCAFIHELCVLCMIALHKLERNNFMESYVRKIH